MASNTDVIENWSDSEIRTKLAELGTPVGPVTETTRKILIKKLKRLLQLQGSNASSPAKQRRSLVRYSSGEDSQGEESNMPPPTSKIRNLRRKTTGSAELSTALADSSINADVTGHGTLDRAPRLGRKSIASVSKTNDLLDTDSDSDGSLTYAGSRLRKSGRLQTNIPSSSSAKSEKEAARSSMKIEQTKTFRTYRTTEAVPTSSRIPEYQRTVHKEEEEEDGEEETEEDEEQENKQPAFQSDFLTRLSTGGRFSSSYRSSASPKPERKLDPYPTFSSLSASRPSDNYRIYSTRHDTTNSYSTRLSDSAERGGQTSFSTRSRTVPVSVIPKVNVSTFFTRYKSNMKMLLIGATVVAVLAIIYYILFSRFSTRIYLASIDSDENNYPICGNEGVDSKMCVANDGLKGALDVSKVFIPRILDLTTKAYCEPPSAGDVKVPSMSDDEALKYLGSKMSDAKQAQLQKNLRNFKILVLANPHWEVEIATKGLTEPEAILFNGEFVARRVDLPTGCYLRVMAYNFVKLVIFITVIAGLGVVGYFGARLYKHRQERHKQEVYYMVNKVLNLLSAHHEQNILPGYLAINNCRDELIQPIERDAKRRVWDDAVNFIEEHESRVRTEMHSMRGENVKVWRWLPAGSPPVSPNTSLDSGAGQPILGRLL